MEKSITSREAENFLPLFLNKHKNSLSYLNTINPHPVKTAIFACQIMDGCGKEEGDETTNVVCGEGSAE